MARFSVLLLVFLLVSCSASKNMMTEEESNKLEAYLNSGEFQFEADWAYPMVTNSVMQISNARLLPPNSNAGRIDLIGNINYINFKNDSVQVYLPYFGERQINSGYGNQDNAIIFEAALEESVFQPNKKNTSFEINFKGVSKTESYRVQMNVFPNKKANIYVNSSHRLSIGYSGILKPLPIKKEKEETVFK